MNSQAQYWDTFWNAQNTPLHENMSDSSYKLYSDEIKLIFKAAGLKSEFRDKAVLEIGCGDGAFFDKLDFNINAYKGIDLSEPLIDIFQKKHPSVKLERIGAATYFNKDEKYDLVFGNGIVQYLKPEEFLVSMEHYKKMLTSEGMCIFTNVPYVVSREAYYRNGYGNHLETLKSKINALLSPFKLTKSTKNMGHWYNYSELNEIAERVGMKVKIFGCVFYPYRVSMVFKNKTN
jgi:2-polyprenyl-3-methyl-5-hydroxy-6-metoxy-1,4-benzoquinol methylase